MHEKELYRSQTYSRNVIDAIQETLKAVSENVFPSVGLLDVVDRRVLVFQHEYPDYMKGEYQINPSQSTLTIDLEDLFDDYFRFKKELSRQYHFRMGWYAQLVKLTGSRIACVP